MDLNLDQKDPLGLAAPGAWFFEESQRTLWVQLNAQHCMRPFFTASVSWQVTPYEVSSEPLIGFNFGKYLSRIDRQLGTPKTA